tara:strand:+ start:89 stop:337 length:249 start_codon:yes stop_codon:yes gene_type:complete
MAIKQYANEHPKFNMFEKYKADRDSLTKNVEVTGMPNKQKNGENKSTKVNLDTARALSGNPILTKEELNTIKETTKDKEKII